MHYITWYYITLYFDFIYYNYTSLCNSILYILYCIVFCHIILCYMILYYVSYLISYIYIYIIFTIVLVLVSRCRSVSSKVYIQTCVRAFCRYTMVSPLPIHCWKIWFCQICSCLLLYLLARAEASVFTLIMNAKKDINIRLIHNKSH